MASSTLRRNSDSATFTSGERAKRASLEEDEKYMRATANLSLFSIFLARSQLFEQMQEELGPYKYKSHSNWGKQPDEEAAVQPEPQRVVQQQQQQQQQQQVERHRRRFNHESNPGEVPGGERANERRCMDGYSSHKTSTNKLTHPIRLARRSL